MFGSVLLVGWLLAGQAAADDASLKAEVRKLVKQLDEPHKLERESAKTQLLKLGPKALDFLPPPAKDGDVVSGPQREIEAIRTILQLGLAEAVAQASTVTLHGKMPLSKALAAISAQTSNPITDARAQLGGPVPDPELSLDFDKTPFWPALDRTLDQAQVSIYMYGQPDGLQVVARSPEQLPRVGRASIAGPFRVEAVRAVEKRDLRSSSPTSLTVVTEVAWEPRLHPIGTKERMAGVAAKTDAGEPIAVEDPQSDKEAFPRQGISAVEIEIPFVVPAKPTRRIASLKGSIRAVLPGKVEAFRFKNIMQAKKTEQHIAGATVVLEEVRKNGDTWEVYMHLRYAAAGDALESHRNWVQLNEAYLEGADGKPIPFDSMETTSRTGSEVGFGYVFGLDKPPADLTFVYKTPGTIVTKDFPYELENIELP